MAGWVIGMFVLESSRKVIEPTETHDESSNKLKHVDRLGLSTMDGSTVY